MLHSSFEKTKSFLSENDLHYIADRPIKGNPREPWILDSTLWIPDSMSVDSGFQVRGFRIPRSKSGWMANSGFQRFPCTLFSKRNDFTNRFVIKDIIKDNFSFFTRKVARFL